MKQTIAQFLNIKDFPFSINDKFGNTIYYEVKSGDWVKQQFNSDGKVIYSEDNEGFWCKREYDSNGKQNYFESSDGTIEDNRPKQNCNGKIVEIEGKKYKLTEL